MDRTTLPDVRGAACAAWRWAVAAVGACVLAAGLHAPIVAAAEAVHPAPSGKAGFTSKPDGLDDAGWLSLQDAVTLAIGEQGKLYAADGGADDNLGLAVSLHGDTALVGAPGDDVGANANQGSAYAFVRVNGYWSLQARFTASDGAANDAFGTAVAIYGETAVIGAPADDVGANANQGSAHVYTRSGRTWSFQAKLVASDGAASDLFGQSVALSGETALIGVPYDDYTQAFEIDIGSAQVYVRNAGTWTRQAKLVANATLEASPGANLGWSVALSGDTALVGAFRDTIGATANEAGSAFVFVRNGTTWSGQAKLTASASTSYANFGTSVAVYGDTALVGAPRDDIGGNILQGSAYFYVRGSGGTWSQFGAKVIQPDGAIEDLFGTSVALSGDLALVGARNDDIGANNYQGAVYVYARGNSQWAQQQKVVTSDGGPGDRFGVSAALYGTTAVVGAFCDSIGANVCQGSAYVLLLTAAAAQEQFGHSVAVDGDTAVVGVPYGHVSSGVDRGAAYVFTRTSTGWSQQAMLGPIDALAAWKFGWSVAISGETVLVGAPDDSNALPATNVGSVFVFTRSGSAWRQQARLTAGDGQPYDHLGWSVAIAGDLVLAGAPDDDEGINADQGSAYVFVRSGSTWTPQAKLLAAAGDGQASDRLGFAVALSGNSALLGAPGDDYGISTDQGSAYVFTGSGGVWSQQQKLTANDGAAQYRLGCSVAIAGESALMGSAVGSGSYVFVRDSGTWSLQAKLVVSGPGTSGANACSRRVALDADTALVGAAYQAVGATTGQGAAYLFRRTAGTWGAPALLVAGDGAANDYFGYAVALTANTALIGSLLDDIGANIDQGSAHIHVRDGSTWVELAKLTASGVRTEVVFRDGFE